MITENHPKRTKIEDVIEAFFVLNELSGSNEKIKVRVPYYERISTNSFCHTYAIRKCVKDYGGVFELRSVIRIKHNMLKNEIIAEIDEKAFKLNVSRYKPLKKYRKNVSPEFKQGERFVEIKLKDEDHLSSFLNDMQEAIYDYGDKK